MDSNMDHQHLLELDMELAKLSNQSPNHFQVAHTVRSHTYAARVEMRTIAIIAFISSALSMLLREKNPYFLSTAASMVGLSSASLGLIALGMKARCEVALQRLKHEHPIRLKHILQEIRMKISELTPVVDQVEDELFPPES